MAQTLTRLKFQNKTTEKNHDLNTYFLIGKFTVLRPKLAKC